MCSPASRFFRLAFIPILLVFLFAPALARQNPLPEGQPRLLGAVDGVETLAGVPLGKGLIAAVTADANLTIYRQQEDAAPVSLTAAPLLGDNRWIAALGKFAYVSGDEGVQIFKINKDGRIQSKGALPGSEPAGEIKTDGNRLAAVHDGAWSLWDCADRAEPALLAHIAFPTDSTSFTSSRIALGGDRVVVDGTVFDISDPEAPVVSGQVPTDPEQIAGLEIAGDRLYLFRIESTDGGSWIYGDRWFYTSFQVDVHDLADTGALPRLTTHYLGHSKATLVRLPHPFLTRNDDWIVAGFAIGPGVLMIDTKAPAGAEPLWIPVTPSRTVVRQDDQLVGLGDPDWAFAVPPTAEPGRIPVSPAGTGHSGMGPGYSYYSMVDADVADGLVAVSYFISESDGQHYWNDFSYIDLFQPDLGSLLPIATINYGPERVALIDGYLLAGSGRLYAADISDPAAPGEMVRVPEITKLADLVALDGGTVAIADTKGGFNVYDLTDPAAPQILGTCPLAGYPSLMSRDGDKILVTFRGEDLIQVVDVSDPTAPSVCRTVSVPGMVYFLTGLDDHGVAMTSFDHHFYQADFDYGAVQILPSPSESALELPQPARMTRVPLAINNLVPHGRTIFGSGDGLHAYDPESRTYIANLATDHPFLGAVSCQDRLYAVCLDELVDVTEFSGGMTPGENPDLFALRAGTPRAALGLSAVPNPFNPMTKVSFTLASEQSIDLAVYDLGGRRVRELAGGMWTAERHVVEWNGRDDRGREMASGIYFVRLEAGPESAVAKVTLVR